MGSSARVAFLCAAVALVAGGVGCAHHTGKQAAAGMMQGLTTQGEEHKSATGQYPSQMISGRVAQGAIETATSPEQAERLQELSAQLASAAVARALETALGPGEG